jgi:Electron transfer DM13
MAPRWMIIAGVLIGSIVGIVAGLALFQPWRLATSTTVTEGVPASRPTESAPITLAVGTLVSQEHRTTGRARILQLPDGARIVRLEELSTSDGPALHVWLSDQPVRRERAAWGAFDDGAHLDLGDLKGNRGDQNYAVPAGADLRHLTSLSIWCARFHVSFGAASLMQRQ